MDPEDIVKTDTGMRMLRAVTPIYDDDEYQLSIFNANGLIMEQVLQAVEELRNGVFIGNATWSLVYWEQLFQINPTDNQTIEQRRRNIILKMNEYFPVTRRRMESIVDTFTENGGVAIDDERGDYIFEISLKNSGAVDLIEMTAAIEETKPAHLDYKIIQENDSSTFFGLASLLGDETTIYPWRPTELKIDTKINISAASQSHETLAVYPQ